MSPSEISGTLNALKSRLLGQLIFLFYYHCFGQNNKTPLKMNEFCCSILRFCSVVGLTLQMSAMNMYFLVNISGVVHEVLDCMMKHVCKSTQEHVE